MTQSHILKITLREKPQSLSLQPHHPLPQTLTFSPGYSPGEDGLGVGAGMTPFLTCKIPMIRDSVNIVMITFTIYHSMPIW